MKKCLVVSISGLQHVVACASANVSGRVTKDGHPIVFKHRESGKLHNMTVVVQGQRYRYLVK